MVIGSIFLVASVLKAHALWSDSGSPFGTLFSAKWEASWMEFEFVLGCWLLWGAYPALLWTTAFIALLVVSAGSLVMGIQQRSTCGCFGRVQINPWYTFVLDLVLIGLLCWGREPANHLKRLAWRPSTQLLLGAIKLLASTTGIFIALALALSIVDSNLLPGFLSGAANPKISISPEVTDLGEVRDGEMHGFNVMVTIKSDRAIQVIGGTLLCNMDATDSLPVEIPAHDSRYIRVRIEFYNITPGWYQRPFKLHYACDGMRTLSAQITARVAGASTPDVGTATNRGSLVGE